MKGADKRIFCDLFTLENTSCAHDAILICYIYNMTTALIVILPSRFKMFIIFEILYGMRVSYTYIK